jgi:16S rRNA processing protein RimM
MMLKQQRFLIAQIGRTVGLKGDLKLHIHTDFPEQFKKDATFSSDRGELQVADINFKRGTIHFVGYDGVDNAKKLTNAKIYSSLEQTKELCSLDEGEHFWFDIIGCDIVENKEVLGKVVDIQRLLDIDYLSIKTTKALVEDGMPKEFLLPYIPRYIIQANVDSKEIQTQDAKDILEAS